MPYLPLSMLQGKEKLTALLENHIIEGSYVRIYDLYSMCADLLLSPNCGSSIRLYTVLILSENNIYFRGAI